MVSLEGEGPVPITSAEADSIATALRAQARRADVVGDVPGAEDLPDYRAVIERILLDGGTSS